MIPRSSSFSHHKDSSVSGARVAAAHGFTRGLKTKRLTTNENGVVVESVHQVRVHVAEEKADLWRRRKKRGKETD